MAVLEDANRLPIYFRWNSVDVIVASPLDYETTRQYQLHVKVSDGEFVSLL